MCLDTIIGGFHSFRYLILEKAYSEFARVLKPEGILAFTLWNYWSLCLLTLSLNVKTLKIPWTDFPAFPSPKRGEVCNDLVWFYREKKRLHRKGFKVLSVLSTRRFPLLNRYMSWRSNWYGCIGTLIGYDVIIICKNRKTSHQSFSIAKGFTKPTAMGFAWSEARGSVRSRWVFSRFVSSLLYKLEIFSSPELPFK